MGEAALKLHKALGLAVYSRTDFILDDSGNAWCLEINTLPGFTSISMYPSLMQDHGFTYAGVVEELFRYAKEDK